MISSRSRRRSHPRAALWLGLGAAAVVLFGVGVAVGEALHDTPHPGGTRTYVRTLHPLKLAPSVPTRTITVTSSSPS